MPITLFVYIRKLNLSNPINAKMTSLIIAFDEIELQSNTDSEQPNSASQHYEFFRNFEFNQNLNFINLRIFMVNNRTMELII